MARVATDCQISPLLACHALGSFVLILMACSVSSSSSSLFFTLSPLGRRKSDTSNPLSLAIFASPNLKTKLQRPRPFIVSSRRRKLSSSLLSPLLCQKALESFHISMLLSVRCERGRRCHRRKEEAVADRTLRHGSCRFHARSSPQQ